MLKMYKSFYCYCFKSVQVITYMKNDYESIVMYLCYFMGLDLLSFNAEFVSYFFFIELVYFYVFFEMSLIPTLFIVLLSAGIYLLFYTLLVSLPMLGALVWLYKTSNSLDFYFFNNSDSLFLYLCTNMVFFVKIVMYGIHLWLPEAHTPISGSMILAGVMLKLGGYSLLRLMNFFMKIGLKMNIIFIVISLIGGAIIAMICVRQSDMKMLIAYFSVSYMELVLTGIMTMDLWGFWGALVLMLGHGLCSSGLFSYYSGLYTFYQINLRIY